MGLVRATCSSSTSSAFFSDKAFATADATNLNPLPMALALQPRAQLLLGLVIDVLDGGLHEPRHGGQSAPRLGALLVAEGLVGAEKDVAAQPLLAGQGR